MNNQCIIKWSLELATQEYAGNITNLLQNSEHPNREGFK